MFPSKVKKSNQHGTSDIPSCAVEKELLDWQLSQFRDSWYPVSFPCMSSTAMLLVMYPIFLSPSQWHHDDHHGVSNRMNSTVCSTGNSSAIGGFPSQRAGKEENVPNGMTSSCSLSWNTESLSDRDFPLVIIISWKKEATHDYIIP